MREPKFQWGPIARGIYLGLISCTLPIMAINYLWAPFYLLFLLFLGLGLRPMIEHFGLYDGFHALFSFLEHKRDRAWLERRRQQIEQQERQKKLKKSRYRDPNLPKNW